MTFHVVLYRPKPGLGSAARMRFVAALVTARREGRNIYYAVEFEKVRALLAFLTDDCCGGRPDLCGGPRVPQKRKREAV